MHRVEDPLDLSEFVLSAGISSRLLCPWNVLGGRRIVAGVTLIAGIPARKTHEQR